MSGTVFSNPDKPTAEFVVGCDPKVHIVVLEDGNGGLSFKVTPLDPEDSVTDIDALFFNFVDPDVIGSIGLWSPDATSADFVDDGLNTLTDGTQLVGDYDGRVEFGTGDTGVEGEVSGETSFTIWADRPLTLDDLDFESFSMVINSESGDGQVLTYNEDADPAEDLREYNYGEWDFVDGEWIYVGPRDEGEEDADDHETSFVIEGAVNVQVTLTELEDGDMQVDLEVLDDTGQIGDLQGLFFSLNDEDLVDGLSVSGEDVTKFKFNEDSVTNLGKGVNVRGEVVNEAGKFDGGVRLGTPGMGGDDIQSTSFVLSHETEVLTAEDFLSQPMAVRLTSVGEEGGDRGDSLKLLGYVSDNGDSDECDAEYTLGDVIPLIDPQEEEDEQTPPDGETDDMMIA